MKHRSEIDGLRALAVVPVIFYHAGMSIFSGGYLGVDIFFVISGYLITSILIEEKSTHRFSILKFYERRARRILPALSAVLLASTLFGYCLLPADLLVDYSKSLISVATFTSNLFFFFTSDYFSPAADEQPLLHTWSLAVEEQYYIFFPLIISWLWHTNKKNLINTILILAFMSFGLSQYHIYKQNFDATFYLISSRAWELFSGSLTAFFQPAINNKNSIRFRESLALFGLVLICFSVFYLSEDNFYSGGFAILPIAGTNLFILFSHNTLAGRLLSNKPMVFIGLISYSLYLWHQPILAFLRIKSLQQPSPSLFAIAIIITFLLSIVSWRYIETPFRKKNNFSQKSVFAFSLASITIFSLTGILGTLDKGYPSRFSSTIYTNSTQFSPKREQCHTKGENYLNPSLACRYFGSNITWAIFGDSHLVEIAFELAKKISDTDEGLLHLTFSGCPPALNFGVKKPGCQKWINESLQYLENDNNIKNVLIGFRYSAFLFGDQLLSYPKIPNEDITPKFDDSFDHLNQLELREIYWLNLKNIIERLISAGKNIYILYPIPELPSHIQKIISPFSIFSQDILVDLSKASPADYFFKRNDYILKKLDSLPIQPRLHSIKPFDLLCNGRFCPAVKNTQSLYFDDDHLSLYGASIIADNIFDQYRHTIK